MPPQVANFDEETKARPGIPNWNKTFAFVWRWFCSISYCCQSFAGIVIALLKWLNQRVRVFSTTIATRDCGNFVPGYCTAIMLSHSCFSHFHTFSWSILICDDVWCAFMSFSDVLSSRLFSMSDLCLLTSTLMSHISHRLCLECRVLILMFFNDKMLVFMMCAGYSSQESTVHFGLNFKHLALKRIERE